MIGKSPLRIIAIIQARMASTRLPGKVLLDIHGESMLMRVVERTRRAALLHDVIVATTVDKSDDVILALCQERGYLCYRGSSFDVLDRYYQAATRNQADVIVRITGDCPLIDPDVINTTILALFGKIQDELSINANTLIINPLWDFSANRLPPPWGRTYPIGLDTEVCTMESLERAYREADQLYHREHVMPYIYDPQRSRHFSSLQTLTPPDTIPPNVFRVLCVDHEPDYGYYRWTVDTEQDLALVRQVYSYFGGRDDFSWNEVLHLFQQNPHLTQINANVMHKTTKDVDQRGFS